ncbi:MAG TPA: Gfo/Idh/MocA family oxidoreductase [Chryseolinea sp.]
MEEKKLRFAVIGNGFWANYQIAAWKELTGIELVAVHDSVRSKAESIAHKFHVPKVYDSVEELFRNEQLDFVDIITNVETHAPLAQMAAQHGVTTICQKPMAPKLHIAQQMVDYFDDRNVPLYVHENWRWQSPIRKLKELLNHGTVGKIFKARVTFCSAFPVFENQPFLAELDEFILTDIGSHILDVCRFLFGEVGTLHCHASRVNPKIKGEDTANVFMKMKSGVSCYAEMSYASILEYESFPQTFILAEGDRGSIHLTKDYELHVTTRDRTDIISARPKEYPWADPKYSLVHSSIVDCNRNILNSMMGREPAETTGKDNFETVRLVHASYASARTSNLVDMQTF